MMQGGGEALPLVHAPALGEIYRRQFARPHWRQTTPLPIEPELWHQAQGELRDILAQRGWPLLTDAELSKKGVLNFLLYGVAIVMDDA